VTAMASRGWRLGGLLASGELPAVEGRGRLLAVEGGRAGAVRCGALAARSEAGPLRAAVGMPAAMRVGRCSA
jgi:hypothetical protein